MTDPPGGRSFFAPLLNPRTQAVAAGALALAVYLRTLAPTVMWYDMGEFATAAYVLGVAHNTGYPLLLLLGKLFTLLPVGDIAYRVNLMSAVFAALTVSLIYLIVYHLTARRSAAFVAALTLAFTSTLWSNATWATSYNLNAFLTVLILFLLLRWWADPRESYLQVAALTFGLSLGNHRLILGLIPTMAYMLWISHRPGNHSPGWRRLLTLAALFLLGFSINLYLPLRAAQDPAVNWGDPSTFARFIRMVTSGYGRAFINPFESLTSLAYLGSVLTMFPLYEFTAAGLALAGAGAIVLGRTAPRALPSTALLALSAGVMISVYGIHNIYNYFQPIYLVLAVWLGAGAGAILAWIGGGLAARLGFRFLAASSWTALATGLLLTLPLALLARNLPRLDRSGHLQARDYAEYLLSYVEPNSVVLADFWSWAPLIYAQAVEGKGDEVSVSSAISQPGLDQQGLVNQLLAEDVPTYLVVSSEESTRLQIPYHHLQLVAPNIVFSYPTPRLPLPQYKDLLVPRGSVYRAVEEAPDLLVNSVPAGLQLSYAFEEELELLGFELQPDRLQPGQSFQASYYWRIPQETDQNYWVDVLFTDALGRVTTLEGFPLWIHSHWLGGGPRPTSSWIPGAIIREAYDGLVPRSVEPGIYRVSALVYTGPDRERRVPLMGAPDSHLAAELGWVEVVHKP